MNTRRLDVLSHQTSIAATFMTAASGTSRSCHLIPHNLDGNHDGVACEGG